MDLLWHVIRVQLEANWAGLNPFGLAVAPVDDLCAVADDLDPVFIGDE